MHKAKPASDDGRDAVPSLRIEDADAKMNKLSVNSPSTKSDDIDDDASSSSTDEADRANEAWVENIRIIEALRSFIREKLEKGEFEKDAASSSAAAAREGKMDVDVPKPESLYPTLQL